MLVTVDADLIDSVVRRDSLSRAAAALLGVPWPRRPGWRFRAIGTVVDVCPMTLARLQRAVRARGRTRPR